MPFGEPPTYTVADLERRAQKFLHEQLGQDVPIPVDIDLLLEQVPEVDLDYWPGLRSNHGLEGMVARDVQKGSLYIFIDADLADTQPTRYRMTVAEELAHLVLHRKMIDQITEPADFRELQRHYRWHEMERNAKRFGAAILMPGDAVTREARLVFPKLVRVAGFGNIAAVQNHLVSLLAKTFEVSAQAMKIRLTEWPMRVFDNIREAMESGLDYWD